MSGRSRGAIVSYAGRQPGKGKNMNFIYAVAASILVSVVSLVGVVTLFFKEAWVKRMLVFFISFAAGGLIGGAFLHLLPEAIEHNESGLVFVFSLIGFILFFMLERYFCWRD